MGVRRLIAHGYPPTMVLMYDEAWLVGEKIRAVLEPASGNSPCGDWYIFHVDPHDSNSHYSPGPPHRDRPAADESSFRPAATAGGGPLVPKYCSVWMALTEVRVTRMLRVPNPSVIRVSDRLPSLGGHDRELVPLLRA